MVRDSRTPVPRRVIQLRQDEHSEITCVCLFVCRRLGVVVYLFGHAFCLHIGVVVYLFDMFFQSSAYYIIVPLVKEWAVLWRLM